MPLSLVHMQIRIIAVGRIKEKYLKDAIAEYEKRLRPYVNLQVIVLAEERRAGNASVSQETYLKEQEGVRILESIPPETFMIALDVTGSKWSSEELARNIREWGVAGKSSIAFVIGGDLGLGQNVLTRCNLRLSLSPLTFTHQMARVILLEQIYRSMRINRGEPYHK
ncbi:MAG: Ribosomal RNA large subunit methyltransferase H [Methanoregula sp. SKADARSKE-2]|nr:MAG: Ribosomal RNA large subunit methyltransferase H [Methanoregula sp. SKADARSKE-2]